MTLLTLLALGMLLGAAIGCSSPNFLEAGASRTRGALVGLRNGALYATAFLGAVYIQQLVLVGLPLWPTYLIIGVALLIGFGKRPDPMGLHWGAVWGLATVALLGICAVLGLANAATVVVLGWLGGFVAGGVLSGGLIADFFNNIGTPFFGKHITAHSARYGAAAALLGVMAFAPLLGGLTTAGIVATSLLCGFGAGLLTARGKCAQRP